MTETVLASRAIGGQSYQIDTDPSRLDIALIHDFLAGARIGRAVSRAAR